jgi:hypothetical protein
VQITSIVALFFIKKAGRRPLMLSGMAGMALTSFMIGSFRMIGVGIFY